MSFIRTLKIVNNKVSYNANQYKLLMGLILLVTGLLLFSNTSYANSVKNKTDGDENSSVPFSVDVNVNSTNDGQKLAGTLQILLVLTVISLAPSILVMLTSFTRIIVALHFVRQAIGTTSSPPNQVLIGLALFLTGFIMAPTFGKINTEAIQPLSKNKITYQEAFDKGIEPLREFMLLHTNKDDINLFIEISGEVPKTANEVKTVVLIPAFIISELRSAFIIGFLIYIPFIVIDMVVASTLMAMGMMMLPPTTISMPFKLLLFIMADGWSLFIEYLVKSFNV